MSQGFVGAWRVSEYVHNPDGCFVGVVRQQRELEKLDNGHVRVTQHCEPDDALTNHPMGRFAGTWVFDLSVDGSTRLYHGPDVVGFGSSWGEGAMTGRGLWPNFGHNFSSFAVLASPARQLTGGKFFNASQMIANVVGVAVPEGDGWPELKGAAWAGEVADIWTGTKRTVDAEGNILEESARRSYKGGAWVEDGMTLEFTPLKTALACKGQRGNSQLLGLAQQVGPLCEGELVMDSRWTVEFMDVLDSVRGHLVSLRRVLKEGRLEKVEVLRLRPEGV